MKVFKIINPDISGGIRKLNKSINSLSSKADTLMENKTKVTGLLPNSMKKCNGTGITVPQMIDLILRNI